MKKSIMSTLREMTSQSALEFPIEKLRTIKNYVSILNTERFLQSERWETEVVRELGVIRVKRI